MATYMIKKIKSAESRYGLFKVTIIFSMSILVIVAVGFVIWALSGVQLSRYVVNDVQFWFFKNNVCL